MVSGTPKIAKPEKPVDGEVMGFSRRKLPNLKKRIVWECFLKQPRFYQTLLDVIFR